MKMKVALFLLLIAVITMGMVAPTAQADTARVNIKGPSFGVSYTVQIWQNGVLKAQQTGITLPLGCRLLSYTVPSGCGYIANAWVEGIDVESHTWPSKCVSGTTHLGCLQFGYDGEPQPWSGPCPCL